MVLRFLMITALLFSAGLSFSSEAYPRLNGVQVFVLDKAYDKDLDTFFAGLKAGGYDTVFLRVFHNGSDRYHYGEANPECRSGVYFQTDEACVVRDVLSEAVSSARKHNLRIYAWMATRSLTFLKTTELMERSFTKEGTVSGYGASIFKKEVRDRLIGLFWDLAKYDIDGILFQDDFILKNAEGASPEAVQQYLAETGETASYETLLSCSGNFALTKVTGACPENFLPWVSWKNKKLMGMFSDLRAAAEAVKPDIKFAGNVYYETPLDRVKGLSWYAQSIRSMLDGGFDYLAVMGYHDQIGEEMLKSHDESVDVLYEMTENLVAVTSDESRVVLKLQLSSFSKNRTVDDVQLGSLCRMTADYPFISRVLVPVNSLSDINNICFTK
ncbi:poly-beta-1,6-N-acetyl-D-glucosamine N-deacetylase PgaB [Seleniivibrio woodruffii]|uniref:poly-beta-1,6-N-acetyl-D-glucosamine N-deacetylase PgaB n=1 Tax=Seleniivibrio woodruffii TaxID=1078050 RepID=UPI0039E28D36